MTNYEQVVNDGLLYINGIILSNNTTTPNSKIDISPGICRDSTNVFDINLGNYLGANPNISADTVTTVSLLTTGVNALDTGTVAASTMYNLFVIADAANFNPTACLVSTSDTPVLPFGYGVFRKIGYWMTDGSSNLLLGYTYGNNSDRKFVYDAIKATSVTAGVATTYTAISLAGSVPALNKVGVVLSLGLTPNAASDTLSLRKTGGTGDQFVMKGQVAAVQLLEQVTMMAGINAGNASIDYKVSTASASAVVSVLGFNYSL